MPVYEVSSGPGSKPRLIKAKNINGARAHAAAELDITRPTGERVHVLTSRGTKLEYAEGCKADVESPTPGDSE